jgi:hypothetical protein
MIPHKYRRLRRLPADGLAADQQVLAGDQSQIDADFRAAVRKVLAELASRPREEER